MKKVIMTKSSEHSRVKRISTRLEGKSMHVNEIKKRTKRANTGLRSAGEGPNVTGAVDTLVHARHKLACFAALFSGEKDIVDLIDHAGAWIILMEILNEIEEAENLLTGS